MEYGMKLLVLRAARGLTQAEAAQKAGITEKQLGLMERGLMFPGPEMEARIAVALDWPQEELAEVAFGILGGEFFGLPELQLRVMTLEKQRIAEGRIA